MTQNEMQQLKKRKAKIIFDRKPSIIFIAFAILSMLVSLAFISMRFINAPIDIQDAVSYKGELVEFSYISGKGGKIQSIHLALEGTKTFHIDTAISTEPLYNALKELGNQELEILVNERAGTIIQITHNGEELLDAERAQTRLYKNGLVFLGIGIALLAASIVFMILALKNCFRLKREEKEYLK